MSVDNDAWYYLRDGEQVGPFGLEELRRMAKAGIVPHNAVVIGPDGRRRRAVTQARTSSPSPTPPQATDLSAKAPLPPPPPGRPSDESGSKRQPSPSVVERVVGIVFVGALCVGIWAFVAWSGLSIKAPAAIVTFLLLRTIWYSFVRNDDNGGDA